MRGQFGLCFRNVVFLLDFLILTILLLRIILFMFSNGLGWHYFLFITSTFVYI